MTWKHKNHGNPTRCLSEQTHRPTRVPICLLIIDEVRLLPEFEDVLNSFLRIPNLDVYVSGSNSRFLSSDVITEFRGRGDEIRVHPLSFRE